MEDSYVPCMIFMVWPMRLGCWACGRVFGVNRGLSLSVVWRITKHLKPVKGFLHGWTIEIHGMDEMALFASKMLSVDWKYRVLPLQI